ncbi:MAG: glucose-6-phosphate isomerase family protein [Fimbriimonas sp.]|nr:glucose-6-phosphate isomerase family protein [Fimbriimonas sp.]
MQSFAPLLDPQLMFDSSTGLLKGEHVISESRRLADLAGVFADEAARSAMEPNTVVYSVSSTFPVENGKVGGLFFGCTTIQPGTIGGEYFMTKGHFHTKIDTAEFYWCLEGEGALLLMNESRSCRVERMAPGSLHYIPGCVAHRTINTGEKPLIFGACWPSDAGHNYERIRIHGFSVRLVKGGDGPVVVEA